MKIFNKILDAFGWFIETHPYWTIGISALILIAAITIDAIINAETLSDDHPEVTYEDSKNPITNYYKNKENEN